MSSTANRQIVLRRRPETTVTDDCFQLIEAPLREPSPGEVQVRTLWLSFDPAQRGWLNDVPSYVPPVELGAPMRSYGIGEVLARTAWRSTFSLPISPTRSWLSVAWASQGSPRTSACARSAGLARAMSCW